MGIAGKLGPTEQEIKLMRQWFTEAASLIGDGMNVRIIKGFDLNLYNDPTEVKFEEEVENQASKVFDDYVFVEQKPDLETLRSMGWYSEDEEILPIIMYLPYDVVEESESPLGIIVEFPFLMRERYRVFEIVRAKMSSHGPVHWKCKIAPVRLLYDFESDQSEGQSEWFSVINLDKDSRFAQE